MEKKFYEIGYCGNNCVKCKVYKASIENNHTLKKKIQEEVKFYTDKDIDLEDISCYGCRDPRSKHRDYLGIKCIINECASSPDKQPITCTHCGFWPCAKVISHFKDFSLKPAKAIRKAEKKMMKLGENGENTEKWKKKQPKI